MSSDDFLQEDKEKLANKIHNKLSNLIGDTGYCISLSQISAWLNNYRLYERYRSNRSGRDISSEYLNDDEYIFTESKDEDDLSCDFILRLSKTSELMYPWFSIAGFKKYLNMVNSSKSRFILSYYNDLETKFNQMLKDNNIDITSPNKELNEDKQNPYNEIKEMDKTINQLVIEVNKYRMLYENEINKKISSFNELDELEYLRNKYMMKVEIYLVRPEYMASEILKGIDIIEDYRNEFGNPKLYNTFTKWDVDKNGTWHDVEMYYYIRRANSLTQPKLKNFHLVDVIKILNVQHLQKIKDYICGAEEYINFDVRRTAKQNIYRVSYKTILAARNYSFNELVYSS